jgi:GntR family transcriptional regulator
MERSVQRSATLNFRKSWDACNPVCSSVLLRAVHLLSGFWGGLVDIVISSSNGLPIYEQIALKIKAQIMAGDLVAGSELPSMRGLAKSLRVSVITVQRAYEEMQRDGFIDTVVGRGSFVALQSQEFYRDEQQRIAEQHLGKAAQIGRNNDIPLSTLADALEMFYEGVDHVTSHNSHRVK